MKNIRTHRTHCGEHKPCDSGGRSLTEQSHAGRLNIRTMMTQGMIASTNQPRWADVSEIPSLDTLLCNRIRLTKLYNTLPAKTRIDIPTVDAFTQALIRNDADELAELGLISPPEKPLAPDPAASATHDQNELNE